MSDQTVYFVRDDDVGELTEALRCFVATFLEREIPVSYQIIPARLTEACARYLVDVSAAHPGLIEFGQHGLHHRMAVRGKVLNREFGPERDFAQQLAVIEEGRGLLLERLGAETPVTVFTPPQHKYDRSTVQAAALAGHHIFSAAYYPDPVHQGVYAIGRAARLSSITHQGISYHGRRRPEADIDEISISLDVDDGEILKRPADRLAPALQRAAQRTDVVGLMFHHGIYDDAEKQLELRSIADVIRQVGASRLRKLGDLGRGGLGRS